MLNWLRLIAKQRAKGYASRQSRWVAALARAKDARRSQRVHALNVEPHLTFREHQILELVAVGCSAKQIALEINIAPRTVERHIENVRLKLNARNRAHLITQAMHLGLLVIETPSPEEPTLFELK